MITDHSEYKEKSIKHYFRVFFMIIKKLITDIVIPERKILIIFEVDLTEFYPLMKQDENIEIGLLKGLEEIKDFIDKRAPWYYDYAYSLLQKGNYCFYGKYKNKVASCLWTSFNEVYLKEISYTLKVDKNIVPFVDGYTLNEYQGLGIYKNVWNYCLSFLKAQGCYTAVYVPIFSYNKKSLDVHKKLQLQKISKKIVYTKILGLKFHSVKNYLKGSTYEF